MRFSSGVSWKGGAGVMGGRGGGGGQASGGRCSRQIGMPRPGYVEIASAFLVGGEALR